MNFNKIIKFFVSESYAVTQNTRTNTIDICSYRNRPLKDDSFILCNDKSRFAAIFIPEKRKMIYIHRPLSFSVEYLEDIEMLRVKWRKYKNIGMRETNLIKIKKDSKVYFT